MVDELYIYTGTSERAPKKRIDDWLNNPPPWRKRAVGKGEVLRRVAPDRPQDRARGESYVCSGDSERQRVNLALMLRRPLLVAGDPGLGKSSLAYSIAWSLALGSPLRWEINSQTTLRDGLYTYDAVGHFHDKDAPIADFITLGPLGTALLPTKVPRVLLIDELDKSNFDLPNDLLHVFEEGSFTIPELRRDAEVCEVRLHDAQGVNDRVRVTDARVSTVHHPVVVITSNGEREFSEAFRRRCVEFRMERLDKKRLEAVVRAQFGNEAATLLSGLDDLADQPTDIVLQALFAGPRLGFDKTLLLAILGR
jgi:MoxR-like ATPase